MMTQMIYPKIYIGVVGKPTLSNTSQKYLFFLNYSIGLFFNLYWPLRLTPQNYFVTNFGKLTAWDKAPQQGHIFGLHQIAIPGCIAALSSVEIPIVL